MVSKINQTKKNINEMKYSITEKAESFQTTVSGKYNVVRNNVAKLRK